MSEEITHVWERQQLTWALRELEKTAAGTHGNASVRIDANSFLIKPSGVKEAKATDLCLIWIVASGGGMPPSVKLLEGKLNPSVDTVNHAQIYVDNPHVKAICHTHSDYVVAHAIAEESIECLSTEQADMFGGTIHCLPYSAHDVWSVIFKEKEVPAVLLGRHGGLTVADDPLKAVNLALRMEDVARKNFLAKQMFPHTTLGVLGEKEIKRWRKRFLKSYGQR